MDEAMRSMEYWGAKMGIPGVVACIDGSHIPIVQPANSGFAYCNRKGFYSINVQGTGLNFIILLIYLAAVDHRRRFVELTVGWPGSVADGCVFANSFIKANLKRFLSHLPSVPVATKATDISKTQYEAVPAYILADSAYCSTSHLVPTFKNTECSRCRIIKKLNAKLASIRYCIENAFGICKGRFRLLNHSLECAKEDIVQASFLITAIFILHNFLIEENDDTPIEVDQHSIVDANGVQNGDRKETQKLEIFSCDICAGSKINRLMLLLSLLCATLVDEMFRKNFKDIHKLLFAFFRPG